LAPPAFTGENLMAPISVTLARRDPAAAVVALVGEHDAYSSERLENELAVLLDEGLRIVVDLRDASFIDSTTLGVLLTGRQRAERADLGFVLVLPKDEHAQVQQILDLTRLGRTFASFTSLEDGLRAARSGQVARRPSKAA
jgi:anti-anti-sigma factor